MIFVRYRIHAHRVGMMQTVERLEDDLASRIEELSEAKEAVKELEFDLSKLRKDSEQQSVSLASVTSLLERTQQRLQVTDSPLDCLRISTSTILI